MEFTPQQISQPEEQNSKRELTQEEKETLKSFENIPFIDLSDKLDFLWTWRKLKNGSEFELNKDVTKEEEESIIEIVKKSGLLIKVVDAVKPEDSKFKRKFFFIANNQEDLELISKLYLGDHFKPEVYLELGRIYGFPKTAIEAFDQTHNSSEGVKKDWDEFLLTSKEKMEKTPKEVSSFVQFKLSREHWPAEIEVVKKWAEEIKLVDPDFYLKILNRGSGGS
ncbi:MAG: hypothetical protein Q7K54_03835 [Candidatus Parcubacteria bacterium]|nr:hypothetical protein [Candidatus Parcubacteria bacterium]